MQASNSSSELDADGQHYLAIQRHAAAVQLYSRSLAIAHLRAQLAMPRGGVLNVQHALKPTIKVEPDHLPIHLQQQQQQRPPRMGHAAPHAQLAPAIQVSVTSTAADLQLQPPAQQQQQQQQQQQHPSKHVALRPRPLVRRLPDAAAAQRFKADELPDLGDEQAGVTYDDAAAAAAEQQAALAPRIVADPSQLGHQLAGWSRVAGEGADAEEGMEGAAMLDDEDMLGPGAEIEEDNMDEEEWV